MSPARLLRVLRWPLALLLLATLLGLAASAWRQGQVLPIRVGVVHALSGVMAQSERGLVDALRLAADEINAQGGLLGRRLELVLADSRSDPDWAAREARRLIVDERVSVLFACWTSSCRKALKPVVEQQRHLLFYALQYEGMEQSPHIVYLGAAPNQQIIPGAYWAMERFGRRVFLLGSDYLFPRTAHLLIRDLVQAAGGEVLGERYAALDSQDFTALAAEIRAARPDVLLNTVNGAGNRHLFAALAAAGLQQLPVLSFSLAEPELQALGAAGRQHGQHHAVWGYFQSLGGAGNQRLVTAFRRRFGAERVFSDPMLSSYLGLRLWAAAVREVGGTEPSRVNRAIGRISVAGPDGVVALDAQTRHLWRRVYIGQAQADGQFLAQEISEAPVRPAPFPPYRRREEWLSAVEALARPSPPASAAARAASAATGRTR